jgi:hypothetical protein
MIPAARMPPPDGSVLAANRCLSRAFNEGRPAELTVTGGPDDIGHTSRSFFRVVGPNTLEIIWEDIPPHGPIEAARLSDCKALTDVNGQIWAKDCHPTYPVYS